MTTFYHDWNVSKGRTQKGIKRERKNTSRGCIHTVYTYIVKTYINTNLKEKFTYLEIMVYFTKRFRVSIHFARNLLVRAFYNFCILITLYNFCIRNMTKYTLSCFVFYNDFVVWYRSVCIIFRCEYLFYMSLNSACVDLCHVCEKWSYWKIIKESCGRVDLKLKKKPELIILKIYLFYW